ncbi:MAG TPA: neutral/alkaline non-lysosomal ceramidase N-terminal domain-containing protein [Planctomycetota bacterium]|nr:neutral/alkaline non-lysosomal ceramidase N-terminal domain-containing protein [Planctomycetota bacterium]
MSQLQAGAAKANITPYVGAFLAGFGSRDHGCEGVHDELFARALALQSGDTALAIVSCDLIGLTRDSIEVIRKQIEAATGIPAAHVMLACTHTHSGPTMGLLRHPGLDPELVHVTEKKIAGAAIMAHRSMAEAALGSAKGRARVGINRRERKPEGGIVLGKNPEGPTDPDVGVIRVDDAQGKPLALVVNHACHAVVLGGRNYLVSADYPGQIAAFVEGVHPGAVCLYLNGCCGNVNPTIVGGTFDDARRMGTFLGCEAVQAAESLRAGPADLAVRHTVVEAPLAPLPSAEEARTTVEQRTRALDEQFAKAEISRALYDVDWQRGWARDVMAEYGRTDRRRTRALEIQAIRLGDALLLGTPGETFVEIGLAIKSGSPLGKTFVVAYANGNVGYIPSAAAFDEGGYEVESAHKFYYGVYRFRPDVERLVTDAAIVLAKELAGG